ncbi:DUF2079 domain-containing protein [Streptomyces sp. NBC_00038]|uniref:DUF2079 domain-containing protein n=1 Tax=Streptomyces sp. NBC_00038 TaxID=2903615 RepID=UPI002255EB33|nr:DUF2079 domain-containing protein [Streptomyces sp. NBC_00038]MCX5559149.1 DUF2079 domain-containing protein [Streptomyces sp. NBC_00038]
MQASPADSATLPPQQSQSDEQARAGDSPTGHSGIPWWMWALAGALFFAYMTLSLRLHQRMLSNAFDLGIFEQVIRSYADGHLPVSEVKGPDYPVLGDHFHPALALVAPFYRLWPSPQVLLVVQAALIAASVLPLALWARRALGSGAAAVIGICYGLSWGLANAAGFDFHEVAFAVPLLACSLVALGNDRPRAAALWALPLLLVKEDLGLTVAVIGFLIALRGDRKLGIATAVAGLGGTALAMLVILPAFNPQGSYAYTHWLTTGSEGGESGLPDLLYKVTIGLITPEPKVTTLLFLLAPTLFLALRSPLLLVALPTLVWRFASGLWTHWGTSYHYSIVLMPIVFAAFIDALVRRRTSGVSLRRYLVGSAAITALILPQYPLWQLVKPENWRTDPRVAVAHKLMDRIPDGATVQASNQLVPQLTDRTSVSLYGWGDSRPNPEWIMVDTEVPQHRIWPLSVGEERISLDRALTEGYRTAAEEDGFVLLTRSG